MFSSRTRRSLLALLALLGVAPGLLRAKSAILWMDARGEKDPVQIRLDPSFRGQDLLLSSLEARTWEILGLSEAELGTVFFASPHPQAVRGAAWDRVRRVRIPQDAFEAGSGALPQALEEALARPLAKVPSRAGDFQPRPSASSASSAVASSGSKGEAPEPSDAPSALVPSLEVLFEGRDTQDGFSRIPRQDWYQQRAVLAPLGPRGLMPGGIALDSNVREVVGDRSYGVEFSGEDAPELGALGGLFARDPHSVGRIDPKSGEFEPLSTQPQGVRLLHGLSWDPERETLVVSGLGVHGWSLWVLDLKASKPSFRALPVEFQDLSADFLQRLGPLVSHPGQEGWIAVVDRGKTRDGIELVQISAKGAANPWGRLEGVRCQNPGDCGEFYWDEFEGFHLLRSPPHVDLDQGTHWDSTWIALQLEPLKELVRTEVVLGPIDLRGFR